MILRGSVFSSKPWNEVYTRSCSRYFSWYISFLPKMSRLTLILQLCVFLIPSTAVAEDGMIYFGRLTNFCAESPNETSGYTYYVKKSDINLNQRGDLIMDYSVYIRRVIVVHGSFKT